MAHPSTAKADDGICPRLDTDELEHGRNSTARAARRAGAILILLVLGWSTLAAYALHSAFPYNPISFPAEGSIQLQRWFPEGWGFFTRDPRLSDPQAYRLEEAGRWEAVDFRTGPSFLGFNRSARAHGFEMNMLLQQVSSTGWAECNEEPTACIVKEKVQQVLMDTAVSPMVCGNVALVIQEPIPWAWRASSVVMPSKILRLDVRC